MNPKLRGDGWRRRVQVRKLDSDVLGKQNLFWMWWYQTTGNTFRLLRAVVRLSDQLRFLLLKRHGGIYVDSDMLLLRDLTPLCNSTFVYQWSDKDADNSAVFGCPKNCRFVNEFISAAKFTALAYHPLKWRKTGDKHVSTYPTRLPVMTFDPVWLKEIGSDSEDPASYHFEAHAEFTRKGAGVPMFQSRGKVFPASLGYHWHGGFASIPDTPDPNSVFSQLHALACTINDDDDGGGSSTMKSSEGGGVAGDGAMR